jgi:phosphonate transport system permease protein
MSIDRERNLRGAPLAQRLGISSRMVSFRRVFGALLVIAPVLWAWSVAVPPGAEAVNPGGLPLVGALFASALHPALAPDFLGIVAHATFVTLVFAALGTAGALVIGILGGMVLSDVAWPGRAPVALRALRMVLRGVLIAIRSIHELIWALLFVSVLGLDPLVAVLAIAIPFGAQTAKVFADTLDGVPPEPLRALRAAGARPFAALSYALFPAAAPLLLSYSFYRFECAVRSAVVLGVVGVGGLGQELTVSLQSRNWDEVWTLIGAIVLVSAAVDIWSTQLRRDMAVVSCSDWTVGHQRDRGQAGASSRWARGSALVAVPAVIIAGIISGVSLNGLTSPRTRQLTGRLLDDLWPPELPRGGWEALGSAVADTMAMAMLAMAIAVAITVMIGPWASRSRSGPMDEGSPWPAQALRWVAFWAARGILLVLRSIPPTVWAVIALLMLFPGVIPGAVALGLYTGGILGRLVAEAWESIDTRPRDALRAIGTRRSLAAIAATAPPSLHHLVTYTLYRFEICVRDTAIVGVVGAAGLGRLFAENLSSFRFPVITTLLVASFAISIATELVGRRLRAALRS